MYGFHLGHGAASSGRNEPLSAPVLACYSHNCTVATEAYSLTHILLQKCVLLEGQNATVSFLKTIWAATSIL